MNLDGKIRLAVSIPPFKLLNFKVVMEEFIYNYSRFRMNDNPLEDIGIQEQTTFFLFLPSKDPEEWLKSYQF